MALLAAPAAALALGLSSAAAEPLELADASPPAASDPVPRCCAYGLSTVAFSGRASDARRSAFATTLRLDSPVAGSAFGLMGAVGAAALGDDDDRGAATAWTTTAGNLMGGFRWRPEGAGAWGGDAGLGFVVGLTTARSGPTRRRSELALTYATGITGMWDAWLWAPRRVGLFLPVRARGAHRLGRLPARLDLEGGLIVGSALSDSSGAALTVSWQAAAVYTVSPVRWGAAGVRAQLVYVPSAPLFRTQTAFGPLVAWLPAGWRVAASALINIDEPFGFLGEGQRLWGVELSLGRRL